MKSATAEGHFRRLDGTAHGRELNAMGLTHITHHWNNVLLRLLVVRLRSSKIAPQLSLYLLTQPLSFCRGNTDRW